MDAKRKAIKILTQYERLVRKYGRKLSAQRISELNQKRDEGRITINDLPAVLHQEFPGEFRELTLKEIRDLS